MSWEVPTFIVAALALLATIVYGEIQRRGQRRQLRLAQEEARRHPILEVTEVQLLGTGEVDEVQETMRQRQSWVEELERYEEAKDQLERRQQRIREERAKDPLSYPSAELFIPGPMDPRHHLPRDPFLLSQRNYEGPWPHMVIRVTLVNRGRVAALDVSGQLYFEATRLQPLEFPGLDGDVEGPDEEGVYRVALGTYEGSRLLPSPTEETLTFRIAVLMQAPGLTSVKCAFTTPQGDSVERSWNLEVPAR